MAKVEFGGASKVLDSARLLMFVRQVSSVSSGLVASIESLESGLGPLATVPREVPQAEVSMTVLTDFE